MELFEGKIAGLEAVGEVVLSDAGVGLASAEVGGNGDGRDGCAISEFYCGVASEFQDFAFGFVKG